MKTVIITGAAGPLGGRVLDLLSERPEVARIYVLARDGDTSAAAVPKARVLVGDAGLPRLGLPEETYAEVTGSLSAVFHCAERTALDQDLEQARAENVAPARVLVEVLGAAAGARLVHASTTWVSGTKKGLLTEFDLACGQGFYNAYERSKHEAEAVLRASNVADRITIARRSSAVGAADGSPAAPAIDALLHALRGGRVTLASADPRVRLDLVPLDYVARGMVALGEHAGAAGRTVHLVAGWGKSWTLRQILDAAAAGGRASKVWCLPPLFAAPVRGLSFVSGGGLATVPGAFAPYLHQRCVFDDFMARRLLEPQGLACPLPDAWIASTLDGAAPAGAAA
jgi:nucleoside-diphosphate-sugar epimerase